MEKVRFDRTRGDRNPIGSKHQQSGPDEDGHLDGDNRYDLANKRITKHNSNITPIESRSH